MFKAISQGAREAVGLFSSTHKDRGLLGGIFPGAVGLAPTRGTRDFLRAYSTMPWLRAITHKISHEVAIAQWKVYISRPKKPGSKAILRKDIQRLADHKQRRKALQELNDKGELQDLKDHPFLTMIDKANPYLTGLSARKITQIHLDIVGEAFWMKERGGPESSSKERGGSRMPVAAWPIPPHWILSTPTPSAPHYRVSYRAWQTTIPETEILWFRDPDPEFPYGRGSGFATALADELETDEFMAKHLKAFYLNRARPDLLFSVPGMKDTEMRRLQADWLSRLQGYWRAGLPYFMNRPFAVEVLEQDNRCHSSDTEALTSRGWVLGPDLLETDEVATWNEAASRLEWQRPTAIHRYPYDGPMHWWHSSQTDMLVTPNHRLWFQIGGRATAPWRFEESQAVVGGSYQMRGSSRPRSFNGEWWMQWRIAGKDPGPAEAWVTIPEGSKRTPSSRVTSRLHTRRISSTTFAPFLGYFLAEGGVGSREGSRLLTLSQTTEGESLDGTAKDIWEALSAVGTARVWRHRRNTVTGRTEWSFGLADTGLWEWMTSEAGSTCDERRIPAEVFGWPHRDRLALLYAMVDGDGTWRAEPTERGGGLGRYSTASRQLADDVQRLCVGLGLRSRRGGPYRNGHRGMYEVWFAERDLVSVRERQCKTVSYQGEVWCVTVPNGTLFTRRNGSVVVSGNSQQTVQLREHERNTIVSVFGLPPEKLAILTASNRSTIEASDLIMAKDVVIPRLEFLRSHFQAFLVPEFDERLIIDYVNPMEEDREFIHKVASSQAGSAVRRVNEWRELQGLDPIPGPEGKMFLLPGTLTPTEELSEPDPMMQMGLMPDGTPPPKPTPPFDPNRAADRQFQSEESDKERQLAIQQAQEARDAAAQGQLPPQKALTSYRAQAKSLFVGTQDDQGVMVCWPVPPDVGTALTRSIRSSEPVASLHLTLAYLGKLRDLGEIGVARAMVAVAEVAGSDPLSGRFGGLGRFTASPTSDGKDVLYASVDVPGLEGLRERIVLRLTQHGVPVSRSHGFTPHVTLAFLDPTSQTPIPRLPELPVQVRTIRLQAGPRWVEFPLAATNGHAVSEVARVSV